MYYMMHCLSPAAGDLAMLTYRRDHPMRSWASGNRFSTDPTDDAELRAPPEPVQAEVKPGYAGIMAEFWATPVPLMTKRLHQALQNAGVSNLDVYAAEIFDPTTNTTNKDYVAFNIVGKISAVDLERSIVAPSSASPMISMDLDSVTIREDASKGALLFRLAESVNGIVVHESVKRQLEEAGIDTLTFVEPQDWAG
jgi:hypothetical protein